MILYFKMKLVENIYFALPSVSIGMKFSTHAGEGNLNDFFPEKGPCRIIAIRLMKSVQREVRLILATFLLTGRRHLKH